MMIKTYPVAVLLLAFLCADVEYSMGIDAEDGDDDRVVDDKPFTASICFLPNSIGAIWESRNAWRHFDSTESNCPL